MASALGYDVYSPNAYFKKTDGPHVLFNTAPGILFSPDEIRRLDNCIKIDLASVPGQLGQDAISARGLPGKLAAESSGSLIAHNILKYLKEV